MSQLSSEWFKAVICFFSTASSLSSNLLPELSNVLFLKEILTEGTHGKMSL